MIGHTLTCAAGINDVFGRCGVEKRLRHSCKISIQQTCNQTQAQDTGCRQALPSINHARIRRGYDLPARIILNSTVTHLPLGRFLPSGRFPDIRTRRVSTVCIHLHTGWSVEDTFRSIQRQRAPHFRIGLVVPQGDCEHEASGSPGLCQRSAGQRTHAARAD